MGTSFFASEEGSMPFIDDTLFQCNVPGLEFKLENQSFATTEDVVSLTELPTHDDSIQSKVYQNSGNGSEGSANHTVLTNDFGYLSSWSVISSNIRELASFNQTHVRQHFNVAILRPSPDNKVVVSCQNYKPYFSLPDQSIFCAAFKESTPVPPVWCSQCQRDYSMMCRLHPSVLILEPLKPMLDPSEVITPWPFVIAESSINFNTYGVWTTLDLPDSIMFGPYSGQLVSQVDQYTERDISYDLLRSQHLIFKRGKDNWMKYIAQTPIRHHCNLQCVWEKGSLFFQVSAALPRNSELIVWNGRVTKFEIDRVTCFFNFRKCCYNCDLHFQSEEYLMAHLAICTSSYNTDPNDENLTNDFPYNMELSNIYYCIYCSSSFCTKLLLKNHIDQHRNSIAIICSECGLPFDETTIAYHQSKHHVPGMTFDKNIMCFRYENPNSPQHSSHLIQDEQFNTSSFWNNDTIAFDTSFSSTTNTPPKADNSKILSNLTLNEKTGNKSKPMNNIELKSTKKWKQNIENVSPKKTQESGKQCPICKRKFAPTTSMKLHMTTHTGKRSYKCNDCPQSFPILSSLRRHEKLHTNEKDYKCQYCPKRYRQRSNLKRHVQRHLDVKSHKCPMCGKKFVENYYLRRHFLTHKEKNEYFCSICQLSFEFQSIFLEHVVSHC